MIIRSDVVTGWPWVRIITDMADTRTDQRPADQPRTDRDEQNTARTATDDEFRAAYAQEKARWSGLLDRLK